MPTKLQLDHIAYPVSDVPATLHFYREVLELPLVQAFSGDDWGGYPYLMMIFGLGDGRQLALCALRGARLAPDEGLPPDVRHISFSVEGPDELERWRHRLDEHGVAYSEEEHGEQTSLYFTDPNNVILEVTTPTSEDAGGADPEAASGIIETWLADRRS